MSLALAFFAVIKVNVFVRAMLQWQFTIKPSFCLCRWRHHPPGRKRWRPWDVSWTSTDNLLPMPAPRCDRTGEHR